jgi:hypothetical protein
MDSDDVQMKPCKQRRRSQAHTTVTTIREEEQDHHDCLSQDGNKYQGRTSSMLQGLLGSNPSKIQLSNSQQKLTCFQTLLKNLNTIEPAQTKASSFPWKQIHGLVVLHLGNLSIQSIVSEDEEEEIKSETMTTTYSCLWEIYRQTIAQKLYTSEELQVVFALIVDQALNLPLLHCIKSPRSKRSNIARLVMVHLDLVQLLLRYHHPASLMQIESLHVFLARLLVGNFFQRKENAAVQHKASCLLQELAQNGSIQIARTAQLTSAAVTVAQDQDELKANHLTPTFPMTDHLLYWRFLAESANGATKLSHASSALDYLVGEAISSGESDGDSDDDSRSSIPPKQMLAAECLSQIATYKRWPPATAAATTASMRTDDLILKALIQVLINSEDLRVQKCTIPGLLHCSSVLKTSVLWETSCHESLPSILSSLSAIAMEQEDGNHRQHPQQAPSIRQECRIGAATLLLEIIQEHFCRLDSPQQEQSSPNNPIGYRTVLINYPQAMSYINLLLHCDNGAPIQQLAVDFLEQEIKRNVSRVVFQSPSTLSELAMISCSPLTPLPLKQRTMEMLELVTRPSRNQYQDYSDHHYNDTLGIVARQPKVLEAVVAMASLPVHDPEPTYATRQQQPAENVPADVAAHKTKKLALLVLTRLAQNVCNRRILAKQVGVLACLIRYARTLSDQHQRIVVDSHHDSEEESSIVCLVDLKQKIMDLAIAL